MCEVVLNVRLDTRLLDEYKAKGILLDGTACMKARTGRLCVNMVVCRVVPV